MNRQNILKKKMDNMIYRNKMTDKNIMQFKDFKGQKDFNAMLEPFNKKTKEEIEYMIGNSKCNKNYYFEWTTYQSKVKPFYDLDMFDEDQRIIKKSNT